MFASSLFKKRKYLLAALALVLVSFAPKVTPAAQAAERNGVKNVLLVHGAWADGSSWEKVITLLHADGYNVTAVQLPMTSLADDVAVVQRALAREVGRTLLVGHSYGGVVITQVGVDPKVAGLVYVAAFAPEVGESALSLVSSVAPTPLLSDLLTDASGFITLSSAGILNNFAQDLPISERITVAATQGPISGPNAFSAAVTDTAWKYVPSWYVIASNDRAVGAPLETIMAKRINATTITLPSGHLVMLSHPIEVSLFVEKAASSLKQ